MNDTKNDIEKLSQQIEEILWNVRSVKRWVKFLGWIVIISLLLNLFWYL